MRCLWLGWSFLTWLSAMLCTGGCLLPYWIKGTVQTGMVAEVYSDLGLFRRCVYPIYGHKGEIQVRHNCGHYDFHRIPHIYWQICLILLGLACCILFFLTFLLFFLGFCLDLLKVQGVYRSCQSGQFVAGLLTIVSCILYPLGWSDNSEVIQICGAQVTPFTLGRCHIGWAFVLTCAGGLLALLATTLPLLLDHSCAAGIGSSSGNSPLAGGGPTSPHRSLVGGHAVPMAASQLSGTAPTNDEAMPATMTSSMQSDATSIQPQLPPLHLQGGGQQHRPVSAATRYSYVSYQSILAAAAAANNAQAMAAAQAAQTVSRRGSGAYVSGTTEI